MLRHPPLLILSTVSLVRSKQQRVSTARVFTTPRWRIEASVVCSRFVSVVYSTGGDSILYCRTDVTRSEFRDIVTLTSNNLGA
ncbi:hypothetical protein C8Q75DRAFT_895493 [Abortiporus biennis]|nr:hypothetical protein C8Q75DRAFT_895493 [Abortiporus biennis]